MSISSASLGGLIFHFLKKIILKGTKKDKSLSIIWIVIFIYSSMSRMRATYCHYC